MFCARLCCCNALPLILSSVCHSALFSPANHCHSSSLCPASLFVLRCLSLPHIVFFISLYVCHHSSINIFNPCFLSASRAPPPVSLLFSMSLLCQNWHIICINKTHALVLRQKVYVAAGLQIMWEDKRKHSVIHSL